MIGLSVAIGRFIEALFWAILQVAGGVVAIVLGGAATLVLAGWFARRLWQARRR